VEVELGSQMLAIGHKRSLATRHPVIVLLELAEGPLLASVNGKHEQNVLVADN